LLAVGGGSVIDSAKAIAYAMANPEHDIWDFFDGKAAPSACLPVGVVLTIAASGSEMSNSCVITKEEGGMKRSLNTDLARPRFAIMNPELTFTLPPYQTAAVSDIMMHTQERYFANEKNNELIDRIAEGLMVTVLHNAPIVMKDPTDYNARAELMWAGSLSHNGLTGTGRLGDFACHKMEHEIGGMFDVIHGAGLAAIWHFVNLCVRHVRKAQLTQIGGHVKSAVEVLQRLNTSQRRIFRVIIIHRAAHHTHGKLRKAADIVLTDIQEESVFAAAGMHAVLLQCKTEDELIGQCAQADILLNQVPPLLRRRVMENLPPDEVCCALRCRHGQY